MNGVFTKWSVWCVCIGAAREFARCALRVTKRGVVLGERAWCWCMGSTYGWIAWRGPYCGRSEARSILVVECARLGADAGARDDGRGIKFARQKMRSFASWMRSLGVSSAPDGKREHSFPGMRSIRMSSTLDGKREHSFPWMRSIRMSSILDGA